MGDYGMDYQGGGGGGGGFNAAAAGGGGGGGLSQGSSGGGTGGGKQRRSYDEQTLLPVTIRMILTASVQRDDESSDKFTLEDGRQLNQVKFIGAIRSKGDFSTNVILTVEDGTGLIEVKQWNDANANAAIMEIQQAAQQEHTYVKVVGQVKTYLGTLSILADSIRPLSTGNELSHHMLEVVYSAESYKRRNSYVNAPVPQQQMMGGMGQHQQAAGVGFSGGGGGHGQAVAQASGGGQDTTIRNLIRRYLSDHDDPNGGGATGLNKYEVSKAIAHGNGQFQEGDVVQVMDAMSQEGDLYSTVDEDHLRLA